MIDEVKLQTKKGNTYYLCGEPKGDYILLQKEYPYEGCSIDDSLLFDDIDMVEKHIDSNPIKHEYYVIKYLMKI